MIVFDLVCAAAHHFEAWFGSSRNCDDQPAQGLIECPLCGWGSVGKALHGDGVPLLPLPFRPLARSDA